MKKHRKATQDEKAILDGTGDYSAALYVCVCKFTIKAIIGFVKELRAKNAVKTLVADVNSIIAECTNRKSISELEELKNQGVTHIIAGVDKDSHLVDNVILIHNEDAETSPEVVELLGDEGMVVIEE